LADPDLQAIPVGVWGEVLIGGKGLARGYLGRPELTAERFMPDPFGGAPGERLYRTGDRGRFLPDGRLELAGRLDHQVKLRGFRVELGEIEAVLASLPGVREAVAVVRQDDPADPRLVAYLVPGEETPGPMELRQRLAERLPAFMVPSTFVKLDALPRTPNGKIDRRALPAVEKIRPELEEAFVPPHSETERRIAAVWQEVLGIGQVGIHDNFFDLGGQSLLLVRVHSQLRQQLDANLTLIDLFRYPTVATQAAHLARGEDVEEPPAMAEQLERRQAGQLRLRSGLALRQSLDEGEGALP
jgi:hypothetical protein